MMKTLQLFFAVAAILLFAGCGPSSPYSCDTSLNLPDGFCAVVVVDSVGFGRHLAVNQNGDVYLALRNRGDMTGGIVALRDEDGDVEADVIERFGYDGGTGIELYNGYLYFASDTAIVRYPLDGESLAPTSEPELMVSGFIKATKWNEWQSYSCCRASC